jgi:TRAP-type C4-dicarboxylate transport system permease large subunit
VVEAVELAVGCLLITLVLAPLHFGVLVILNLMIGLLTPPIGAVLFVVSAVTRTSVHETFLGTAPFLIPLFAVLTLVTLVPGVALFLPSLVGL